MRSRSGTEAARELLFRERRTAADGRSRRGALSREASGEAAPRVPQPAVDGSGSSHACAGYQYRYG